MRAEGAEGLAGPLTRFGSGARKRSRNMDKAERDAWEKVARGAEEAAEGWRTLDQMLPMFFGKMPGGEESSAMHYANEAEKWAAEARGMLKPCGEPGDEEGA